MNTNWLQIIYNNNPFWLQANEFQSISCWKDIFCNDCEELDCIQSNITNQINRKLEWNECNKRMEFDCKEEIEWTPIEVNHFESSFIVFGKGMEVLPNDSKN